MCYLCRKKSLPHDGVVYLVMPDELREWSELENEPQKEVTLATVPHTKEEDGGMSEDLIEDELDEDEREQSFSAPSSPKLTQRHPLELETNIRTHRRMRSQSFDDILSSVNNEVIPPAPSSQTMPRTPVKKSSVIQIMHPSESDSGSESDEVSMVAGRSSRPSDSDVQGEQEESRRELEGSTEAELVPRAQHSNAFSRFKGRFFQKVKFPQSRSRSQPSTTSATEDSDTQTKTQKLLAMGQKFRNSPGLLRKYGVNRKAKSPQPTPSEEDEKVAKKKEAIKMSQTKFIYI